jgi:soluble lytic murein transglycosylase
MTMKSWTIIAVLLANIWSSAYSQTYLEKFQQFMLWNLNLPTVATPDFIEFINQSTPLSQKLRDRWLYQLAQRHDWETYLKYYQPSNDVNLQCFEQFALVNQGQEQTALPTAKTLWLQSSGQPPGCNALFSWLLKTQDPTQALITQRTKIALENRNLSLAVYLLNQYHPPRVSDAKQLQSIHQKPTQILNLSSGTLAGDFYLYGLKRMISNRKMDEAIRYWKLPKAKQLLNEVQNQSFLSFLVLYKAMRDNDDTLTWFNQIKPAFYNDGLLDWAIRFALKRHQWKTVTVLIGQSPQKDEPCWQYWLARSLNAQGKAAEANVIYQNLAKTRHYYGFLASLRLKIDFHFEDEPVKPNLERLKPYQPITDQILTLYNAHQVNQASRLISDFASELPKDDKSALVQWVQDVLKWHAKSVALSNSDELTNQLSLRFPLLHQQEVSKTASQYQVPSELIYAVIRQESGFRPDVISPAGAHGLMQVLPSTAQKIAKEKKIPYRNKNQLFSWADNINIGTAYLQQLDKRFHHHPILMAAAYNAGPTQVNYWLKNHTPKAIDIWIETLPWRETRNYLKNIIAFYAVYQFRLHDKSDLSWFMNKMS